MKKARTQLLVVYTLGCLSSTATALGLGSGPTSAVLGQPLDFVVPLRSDSQDDTAAECVTADVSFGDARLSGTAVSTRIEGRTARSPGQVRVTTSQVVDEPVVNLTLSVGCRARVSRQYTVLADPPTLRPVAADPEPAQAAPREPAVPAPMPPARAAAAPRPRAEASSSLPTTGTSEAQAASRPARKARPPARTAAQVRSAAVPKDAANRSPPAGAGPRLQLDPLEAPVVQEPALRMSTVLASEPEASGPQAEQRRQAAAAAWKALNLTPEDVARDNERLVALEATLKQLREESAQTRQSLEALNARLREAEAARGGGALVYVLGALCIALAGLAVWLSRRQPGTASRWWSPSALGPHASAPVTREEVEASLIPEATPADEWDAPPSRLVRDGGRTPTGPSVLQDPARRPDPMTTLAAPFMADRTMVLPRSAVMGGSAAAPTNGKVSVEELIDLEQQAEFFEALGQDDAAIELLHSHLNEHPDASPLPYLKLLEIHRRQGDRQAYEDIQTHFNERFNAYAPSWEEDLQEGRTLEDYPGVISRLQGLWETPQRALDVLQASLLRRDATTQTFDLPAYRELLILYSVARDRVGQPAGLREVDVLLPLDAPHEDDGATRLEPLTATTPVKPYTGPEPAVDVDLHLDLDLGADGWQPPPPSPPVAPGRPDATDSGVIEFEPIHLDLPAAGRPSGGKG